MPIAALVPVVVAAIAWIAFCEWDLSRSEVQHMPRWAWALVIVASVPLGGILWLTVGRADE
ncbi:PLDc N-terminal domain-containing protein [Euzebya rosea]|uniref:PLDc N-terminal domain-containing protein n=1 Tax=Euzebya rosea TaxID=2052804 RepID=UPI000D3EB4F5|nr:PLDc N-terminal domain-containing protein [Euzebya rosea]